MFSYVVSQCSGNGPSRRGAQTPRARRDMTAGSSNTSDTVVLPYPKTCSTGPPSQAEVLPCLEFRFEVVEETPSERRSLLTPVEATPSPQPSPPSTTILINLRTLGLDSILPHDAKDYEVAAVKLGTATCSRERVLREIDRVIEELRGLVTSFNVANDGVALSAMVYDAVQEHHHRHPKITDFMRRLVDAIHPRAP
ncbi:hypothetical protein BKA70DRAFT_1222309 [Coprinopsis sp. MPI-PUGE-AT-0042]|nr:hypothetical protein BKA70DRAFT_1222309 [Coprinopsis sp. MPI-PUGE-AT-0042]